MTSTFNIAVTAGNGIGGTEKAAVLFAGELARRGHRVVFITPSGPRSADIVKAGIVPLEPARDAAELAAIFARERIDVIHQHVPGYRMANLNYGALALMGERRPRLVETNVFGWLDDPEAEPWVDFRGFVSRASAVQAVRRSHRAMTNDTLKNLTVLSNPLAQLDPSSRERKHRNAIRDEWGIAPDEILILRIGRPGGKWTRNEVTSFRQARRTNTRLRLLLMETNADIRREVEAGMWGDGILLQPALSDFERLAAIYTAGDVMLHMANWGESYGYTIAEAMQQGLPLIVGTTPWGDNAQVELVEHGQTGFVCNSCEGAAHALLKLAANADLRAKMGAAGAVRIDALSNLVHETDVLEDMMNHVVHGASLATVAARNRDLLDFSSTFADRERRVWEAENPHLRWPHFKGACYSGYRTLRSQAGLIKQALNRGRR